MMIKLNEEDELQVFPGLASLILLLTEVRNYLSTKLRNLALILFLPEMVSIEKQIHL